jgi:hypothetical protein
MQNLNRLALLFISSLLLTGLILSALEGEATEDSSPRDSPAKVLFFIPEDQTLLEPEVAVERLRDAAPYPVGFTPRWSEVEALARQHGMDALMIHYAAIAEVDWDVVQQWFQSEAIVVGGLGIPGEELAELVGMPGLYDPSMGGYTTPSYFFIYSYRIEGDASDMARVEEAGLQKPAAGIRSPLSRSGGGSTESLLVKDGLEMMFHLIESRFRVDRG